MNTRQALIRAASREFALKGYEGASLADIASVVGIKAPSIFKHFSGKRELYEEILAEIRAADAVPAEQFMSRSRDPIEAILAVWEYYWDFCENHPYYSALLFREAFDPQNPTMEQVVGATEYILSLARAYIRHAQEAGEVRQFDPDGHIHQSIMYCMAFFAVPGIRTHLWQGTRRKSTARHAKAAFLAATRHYLEPT